MSNIDKIGPGSVPAPPKEPTASPAARPGTFDRLLEQAANRLQDAPAAPAAPAQGRPGEAAMVGIKDAKPPLTSMPLSPAQTEGLMRAERTMESLEHYQRLLGDEGKSLKQVFQAVVGLDGEVKELTGVLDGMDPQDELYGLLQEVAVTAMMESLKFNRGDYNPA